MIRKLTKDEQDDLNNGLAEVNSKYSRASFEEEKKLTKDEQDDLNSGLAEVNSKYSRASFEEEKKLLNDVEFPGAGYHVHNEDNPTGLHRHFKNDKLDGAHRHTVDNPGGEHVHGEFDGIALTDGEHFHYASYSLGYHEHKEKEQKFLLNKKHKLL